jgi:hypothetical protein
MRALRLTLVAVGTAVMTYAVVGAARTPAIVAGRQLRFTGVLLIAHDGALLPVFLLVGALVHRLVPARQRAVVQAGLIASAAVTVVALPLTLGRGRLADNPSALPRDYLRGLLTVLALVWLAVAVTLVVRSIRARRASRMTRTSVGGGRKDSATDHPVPPP